MRGSVQECIDYCKKDGDFSEFSNVPEDPKKNNHFKRCIDLAENGRMSQLKEEYPGHYLRYKSTFECLLKHD